MVTSNLNLTRARPRPGSKIVDFKLHADHNGDSTVELTCSVNPGSLASGHISLEWWEGNTLITEEMESNGTQRSREIIKTGNCAGVTMRIYNFGIFDYGRYQCKCHLNYDRGIQFDLERKLSASEKVCNNTSDHPVVNILPPGM